MKLKHLAEEYSAPPDIQDHIDEWIETAYNSPELEQWLDHAGRLKRDHTVYRMLVGKHAVETWSKYKDHQRVTLKGIQSTSYDINGFIEGVLEPLGDYEECCILVIKLKAGHSYGRVVKHSDESHPENVQKEFLLKKGLSFTIVMRYKAADSPRFGEDIIHPDAMVYMLA